MKYIEFKVHASRQGIEHLTTMFMTKGIDSVSINDPADMEDIMNKKNGYEWDYVEDDLCLLYTSCKERRKTCR